MLDDGRFLVLILSALAAVASIGAIVAELGAAKESARAGEGRASRARRRHDRQSSWLFIHMVFALHYAHEYYLERRLSGAGDGEQTADEFDGDGDGDEQDVATQPRMLPIRAAA